MPVKRTGAELKAGNLQTCDLILLDTHRLAAPTPMVAWSLCFSAIE